MTSPFMNVEECAAYTRLSPRTIYKKVHLKEIPNRKHGRKLLFHRDEIDAWSSSSTRQVVKPTLSRFQLAKRRINLEETPTQHGNCDSQKQRQDNQGKWFQTPSFKDIAEAKKEEARLFELKRKECGAISEDARMVTLNEYWTVWSKENRTDVSEGWKISQDQMYRDHIKPILAHEKMIDIKAPDIGRVLNRAREKGLSVQTRKHIYSLIRKMFNDAVEYYEMLVVNSVKPKFHRLKASNRKRSFLLPKQAWKPLEHSKDHYLGPAIWIQVLAGLRPSEVQALQGKHLIFDLNQIVICSAYNNKTGQLQDYPKQEDWDYAPMPPQLKQYLRSLKVGPTEFVAKSAKGGMLSYNTYFGALKLLCKQIEIPKVTPHELRHTCTEIYVQAGAPAEDIRRLLNHHSLTATKHYIHRTDERLNSIAASLDLENASIFPKIFPNGKKETYVTQDLEGQHMH